ncbi:MAG: DUF6457 domain-containing protein [Solirubrobacteraceae bacterium]
MNAKTWIGLYADKLGTTAPTPDELKAILELAGEAAHASERVAAPAACWMAARAGVGLQEALALAREVGLREPSE